MFEIKLNTIGKIIKGDNPGWYLQIKDDREETGGYYIFQFKNKIGNSGLGEAFDDWVENFQDVKSYFNSSEWVIEWQE